MKIVVQRVKYASVKVDGKIVGSIDKGLLLLVGFTEGDNQEKIDYMVKVFYLYLNLLCTQMLQKVIALVI